MSKRNALVFSCVLAALVLGLSSVNAAAETSAELLEQADKAWVEGDLPGAEARFKDAVAGAESGEAELRLGGFYLSQNRLEEAVKSFQAALSAGLPTPRLESRAFVGMGIAYLHLDKSMLARAALDEAVRVDPEREDEIRAVLEEMDKRDLPATD